MCKVLIDNEQFDTLTDAAKFLEISVAYLSKHLQGKNIISVKGFKVQRLGRQRKFTKIICLETKEIYNTMTALSEKLKVGTGIISNAFAVDDVFKYNGKSYCRLSEKSELVKEFNKTKCKGGNNHVTVMCKQTGEIFESIKDLALMLNVSPASISNALLKNNIYRKNGLSYTKYKVQDEPVTIQTEQPVQHVLDIIVPNNKPNTKESAEEVIRRLVCDNVNVGDYYVAKVLLEVLEKLVNKTEKNVNNS